MTCTFKSVRNVCFYLLLSKNYNVIVALEKRRKEGLLTQWIISMRDNIQLASSVILWYIFTQQTLILIRTISYWLPRNKEDTRIVAWVYYFSQNIKISFSNKERTGPAKCVFDVLIVNDIYSYAKRKSFFGKNGWTQEERFLWASCLKWLPEEVGTIVQLHDICGFEPCDAYNWCTKFRRLSCIIHGPRLLNW